MLVIILFAVCLLLLYRYGTRNYDYWTKRGILHEKPLPFVGNMAREFLNQVSISDRMAELYRKYPNEKMVGFYLASEPSLVIRDPELIKHVLVTDFAYFYPRGLNPNKDVIEPMLKNLFFADGDLWKLVRQRMTPAFTTGKLKAMFPLIVENAEKLQNIAKERAGCEVDVRDLMAKYTTDFIGACGFGIDADSLNDEDSSFRRLGKRIFTNTKRDAFIGALKMIMPRAFKYLNFLVPEIEEKTVSLMKNIMKQRNYKPSGRNDFIDLLLELKEKGKIVGESIEKRKPDGSTETVEVEFDDLLMAAQIFVFFAAGFETSSSATSYTLHQLAFYPEIQVKCQEEIDNVLRKYDNKLCYDAVKEMKYLEMCFKEGMRMFPSLGFLIRNCTKQYTFPNTDVTIDEGVTIMISLQGLQNDENYFVNPDRFMPERFGPEYIDDMKKHVYLPFGEGPRACIGERLGLMQSLAGLAAVLQKYSVEPSANTLRRPVPDPSAFIVQSILNGLPLVLVERKNSLSP